MSSTPIQTFFINLGESISANKFVKLTLSNRRNKNNDLKNIFVRPVTLKSGFKLQFVLRHPTKDITENYSTEEAFELIAEMLTNDFYNADLFTSETDFHF